MNTMSHNDIKYIQEIVHNFRETYMYRITLPFHKKQDIYDIYNHIQQFWTLSGNCFQHVIDALSLYIHLSSFSSLCL